MKERGGRAGGVVPKQDKYLIISASAEEAAERQKDTTVH